MSEKEITVLIVDDHEVVRRGVRALLDTEEGIVVIGEAANGHEAVDRAEKLKPSVILMDLVMPEMDGIEAIREIRKRGIDSNILVLTSFAADSKLFPAVKAGALGYLLKDTTPKELVQAIRNASAGQASLTGSIARRLLQEFSHDRDTKAPLEPLTEREIDVLRLVARGFSNEKIGKALFISEATVRTHVSNILFKLDLSNRTQAALYALREGLASLDETD